MVFIQANGKITSAATDSTGAKLAKTDCPICGIKNGIDKQLDNKETYCGIYIGKNNDGALYFYGECCDVSSEYYPKYCPECGRKLHD